METNNINDKSYKDARNLELWKLSVSVALFFAAGLFIVREPFKTITYICALGLLSYDIIITLIKSIVRNHRLDMNMVKRGLFYIISALGLLIIGKPSGAVAVMLFFKILRLTEFTVRKKADDTVSVLGSLKTSRACVKRGGEFTDVSVEDVAVGDIIVIKSGDKIPLDGIVEVGESLADARAVTGEGAPVSISAGSEVLSGAINSGMPIYVRVTRAYKDSFAASAEEIYKNYSGNDSVIKKRLKRTAEIFSLLLFAVGVVMIAISFFTSIAFAYRGLMLMAVSSPYFLLSAADVKFMFAEGKLLKSGIIVRSAKFIESSAKVKTFVFDKTSFIENNTELDDSIVAVSGLAAAEIKTILAEDDSLSAEEKDILKKTADHIGINEILEYGKNIADVSSVAKPFAFYGCVNENVFSKKAAVKIAHTKNSAAEIIRRSDAVLMTQEPAKLLSLYNVSKKTYAAVKRSIALAVIVRLIIIALMFTGNAGIWICVLLDFFASIYALCKTVNIR